MTNLILSITLVAIIWYTLETRRLANLTAKQIKINIKPIIVIISIGSNLKLKNIGKSPALNIMVQGVIRVDDTNPNDKYLFKFTEILVCGSEEERGAGITPHCNDEPIVASGDVDYCIRNYLNYSSLSQGQDYKLIIDYEDVEKGKWRSISIVDNKGVHFKEVTELS